MLDDREGDLGDGAGIVETRAPIDAFPSPARSAEPRAATEKKTPRLRRAVPYLLVALFLSAGGYYGDYWWRFGRFLVTTDDAYVGAKSSTISPKVSGYILDVAVDDNA